jgi:serine/threonine protein phosphatase PrpC
LCRDNQWDQAFADSVNFTADPVVATPDVTELLLTDDDEFVIIASDGLWCDAGTVHICPTERSLQHRNIMDDKSRSSP